MFYIASPEPFRATQEVGNYVDSLRRAFNTPNDESVRQLFLADVALTERAVLVPAWCQGVGAGYEPETVSDAVIRKTSEILRARGAEYYDMQFARIISGEPLVVDSSDADASLDVRSEVAFDALCTLLTHMPVSGGVKTRYVPSAVHKIMKLASYLEQYTTTEFADCGLYEVETEWKKMYKSLDNHEPRVSPLRPQKAQMNIGLARRTLQVARPKRPALR